MKIEIDDEFDQTYSGVTSRVRITGRHEGDCGWRFVYLKTDPNSDYGAADKGWDEDRTFDDPEHYRKVEKTEPVRTEASALPWSVDDRSDAIHITCTERHYVAQVTGSKNHPQAQEDAKLIVLAVNNHEKLMKALKELLDYPVFESAVAWASRDAARRLLSEIKA